MNQSAFIEIKNLFFKYPKREYDSKSVYVLKDINLKVKKGEFLGIIGHNGSGKSTLAKLLNGILIPSKGEILIDGYNTKEEEHLWDIRQKAGMVFQNPDNQLVSTIVEEDVAFGPENLGIETSEIRRRVDMALNNVSMGDYHHHKLHQLSGGQKQRIAIAGILAMLPECIIFDEATSMLDPLGRDEVMNTILHLNQDKKITVIHITHNMIELAKADRIIVIDDGKIVMEGKPEDIFFEIKKLRKLRLDVPQMMVMANELRASGLEIPKGIMTVEKLAEVLKC